MRIRGTKAGLFGLLTCVMVSAMGSGTAAAEPLADKSREVTTDDGWQMRITKTDENLDRYPNLAATPFTREGFVSLKAVTDIDGMGTAPVNAGTISLGYQIGCQVDVTNGITIGLAIGPSISIGLTNFGVGGSASISPSVTLKPGTITTIPFATKPLTGRHGSITSDQVHIKIDGCMGPVSLRSYAQVNITTPTADNSLAVYGDPIYL
ncbi:MspA family porin [Nocardia iowensis]|uniref:MspA family porin n=1 Tax=Nocardia iowensis TaxID=204891 RepID=A0ABX8RGZ4_NOCIO|nr:MspA family porin [Nocardia iowensis]QXN88843.1 MspA family porin [Nocardia iowensis]